MVRPGQILQLAALGLLGLGVIMVQSAGWSIASASASAVGEGGPLPGWWSSVESLLASRHTWYAGLAAGVLLVAGRVDLRRLGEKCRWEWGVSPLQAAVAVSLGLTVLTLIPGMGRSVNGASRWLAVGPVTFQPSELVKWVMVLALAAWCARRRDTMGRFFTGLLPAAALLGVGCGLVVIEDLGTALLIGTVGSCLLLAGGARWWQLALGLPVAAAAVAAALVTSPYRLARLTAFLDPWADPAGAGYHPIQSMMAFAQGGVAGRGLGNSIQKHYLPEDTTDFIFPILCEELGFAGGALVIGLVLTILWVGLGIVRDCESRFGRLVGLGVLLTLGLQAAVNIAVVTVVVPTKGIALPLVSAGGTGWLLTALALGLVASLDTARHYETLAREADDEDEADDDTMRIGPGSRHDVVATIRPPARRVRTG